MFCNIYFFASLHFFVLFITLGFALKVSSSLYESFLELPFVALRNDAKLVSDGNFFVRHPLIKDRIRIAC